MVDVYQRHLWLAFVTDFPMVTEKFHKESIYYLSNRSQSTPHLKWKKVSNNSSWDFEHVFDIMDDYWVDSDKIFCPESTPTWWHCYHFTKKWSKSKFDATLIGQNFSWTQHFEDMTFVCPRRRVLLEIRYSYLQNGASEKNFDHRTWG